MSKKCSTYAPCDYKIPVLIAKVAETVRRIIGRLDNGVKADEDAFKHHLSRELSRSSENLAPVEIARTDCKWKNATLKSRFAAVSHEARAMGKETHVALALYKFAAGKQRFDAVLADDDVVVLAKLKSMRSPDEARNFASKTAQIRENAYFDNTAMMFPRKKSASNHAQWLSRRTGHKTPRCRRRKRTLTVP